MLVWVLVAKKWEVAKLDEPLWVRRGQSDSEGGLCGGELVPTVVLRDIRQASLLEIRSPCLLQTSLDKVHDVISCQP